MGGAFTHIAPTVLAHAGYHVVAIDTELDPDFSRRDPNPSHDYNLSRLREAIVNQRCDIGLALDGDGDRVVFVDGAGHIARPEQIAVLLIERCCPQGTVVYDLKCASLVARAAQAGGGTAVMQPSGHGFIKSMMLQRHAELGVEVSGHHFFGVLQGGDDGLFTALVVLGLLRRHGVTLARELQRIGWPCITPDLRLPLERDSLPLLEQIASCCGGQVSRMDGVRAEYDDGWGLARASITEPALTLRFEARDAEHLCQVAARFLTGAPHLLPRVLERIP
jgi:phosphomannomutase/phosphoglucomutase